MKVTLQVNGREMIFSEQELIAIVEKHLASETIQQTTAPHNVVKKPTVGEWFEVKPQAIDQKLFKKKRKNYRQEETRQLILEAFAEMEKNPEKYGKNFKTMMPKKRWTSKTVEGLKKMACKLGDHNADWVEQALEWAQRIANGESWEAICNDADTADWIRLVKGKDGRCWFIGGSAVSRDGVPASNVCDVSYYPRSTYAYKVPLVVAY